MTVSACEDRFTVLLFIAFQSAHDDIKIQNLIRYQETMTRGPTRRRGVAQEMQSLMGE